MRYRLEDLTPSVATNHNMDPWQPLPFIAPIAAPKNMTAPVMDGATSFSPVQANDPTPPRKVHIIGGPGSGKTFLSCLIAQRFGVPKFELDEIAAAGPAPDFLMLRPLNERLDDLKRITALPGWVTEGTALWWTETLFSSADIIIWLDLPVHIALKNVVSRQWREYVAGVKAMPTLRTKIVAARYPHLRHLLAFLPYTWRYYRSPLSPETELQPPNIDDGWALSRAVSVGEIERYRHKVIHCTRLRDVADLLQRFDGLDVSVHVRP